MKFDHDQCITVPLPVIAELIAASLSDNKATLLLFTDIMYQNLSRDAFNIDNIPEEHKVEYIEMLEKHPNAIGELNHGNQQAGVFLKNIVSMALIENGYEFDGTHRYTDTEYNEELLEKYNYRKFREDSKQLHDKSCPCYEDNKHKPFAARNCLEEQDVQHEQEEINNISPENFQKLKDERQQKFTESLKNK